MKSGDWGILRYLLQRVIQFIPTIVLIISLSFAFTRILPGNPARMRVGELATEEMIRRMEQRMGLDKPLTLQFLDYLSNLARGDLGDSWLTGQSVTDDLLQRAPATLELAATAMILALILGVPLGILAAVKRDTFADHGSRAFTVLGVSIPVFWSGIIFILVFYYLLAWAPPPLGRIGMGVTRPPAVTGLYVIDSVLAGDRVALSSAARHLALPAVALGLSVTAPIFRTVRSSMIAALDSDYVLAARAAGMPSHSIYIQDALRNSLVPLLTQSGLIIGYLVGGNVIIEGLFGWPGLGGYVWNAVSAKDLWAIQGFILLMAGMIAIINLLVDFLYAVVDPRVSVNR